MTNITRAESILQIQIKETIAKKKGVDILTFALMLITVGLALFGLLNYAIITLLLSTLGLASSNSLSTQIQILENDRLHSSLDKILEDE